LGVWGVVLVVCVCVGVGGVVLCRCVCMCDLLIFYVFLGRSRTNMNNMFRLVNPVLDRNMFIFKVTVFMKRAK